MIILIFLSFFGYSITQLLITNTGPCDCDLTTNLCDTNCCCDSTCTDFEKKAFTCSNDYISPQSAGCFPSELLFQNNTAFLNVTVGNQFCIYQDNYTLRNFYVTPTLLSATDIRGIRSSGVMPNLVMSFDALNQLVAPLYLVGASIYTVLQGLSVGILAISRPDIGGACVDGFPIGYLTNEVVTCTRNMLNISVDCASLPNTANYYVSGMVIPSTPAIIATNLSRGSFANPLFATVSCPTCNVAWLPTYNRTTGYCNNIISQVKYEILGEVNISSVIITLTYINVNRTFNQQFNVSFAKVGYNITADKYSGNPGYIQGSVILSYDGSAKAMTMITGGSCNSASNSTILFGVNSYGDCHTNISTFSNNCQSINNNINTLFSSYLPLYVTAYGNPSLDNLVPRTINDDNSVQSPPAPCLIIVKLTVYFIFARTGTLTLPQNKIIGYQTTYSYDNITNYSNQYWISIVVKFIDNSATLFDLDGTVTQFQAGNAVKDFLYLLYADNSAPGSARLMVTLSVVMSLLSSLWVSLY